MAKYTQVLIFTKQGNLLSFFDSKYCPRNFATHANYEQVRHYYAAEREIQLIAMFRWENNGMGIKYFCKIKCPVNPLPVKGEFEVPSVGALIQFLKNNGWNYKQTIYPRMFE